jgi:superfamily II DNA or RNA helicase
MTFLRDYQVRALDEARACIHAGAQSVLLCMPTGTGKTRTAVEACAGHVALGGRPMFVAPRRELLEQAAEALLARGLGLHCWVRTIQELAHPGAEIPPASLVVLDEARHYVADSWSRLRAALPDAVYLGLDATPERGDGRGLGSMFDAIVEALSVKDAIAGGHLVPCEVLAPDRALGPGELAQDPVVAYLEHAPGTSGVLFAPTIETAIQYTCRLREHGIGAGAVWGDMPSKNRDRWLSSYATGETKVLANVQLLTEGWDSPRTETVVLARGSGTTGTFLQMVGRALRPFEGKKRALILDLRGVSHIHGAPDESRSWHLDGRACRRSVDDVDVRFCPVCGAVVASSTCEECGHAGEMRHRPPRVLGLPMRRFAKKRTESDEERAHTLARWLGTARAKGYRVGWAFARYRAVYGAAPSNDVTRLARAIG